MATVITLFSTGFFGLLVLGTLITEWNRISAFWKVVGALIFVGLFSQFIRGM